MLRVQVPVAVRNLLYPSVHLDSGVSALGNEGTYCVRANHPILRTTVDLALERRRPRRFDHPVHNCVRNVDSARSKFPCQTLGDGPDREFAGCKICEISAATKRCCGAGDDERGWVLRLCVDSADQERHSGLGEVEEAVAVVGV